MIVRYLILVSGIISVSFASIFIRWIQDAPGIVIAFYRILFAVLLMTPAGLKLLKREYFTLRSGDYLLLLLSGLALGFHFITWISSLHYTTVATSVILVSTNPIFLFLLGLLVLKEKFNLRVLLGIVISLVGTAIIASAKLELHSVNDLLGAGLALSGAFFGSIYMLVGKIMRKKLHAFSYSYLVYTVACLEVGIILVLSNYHFGGYSPNSFLLFFLLAFFPQMIGHTSFNYILKFFSPAVVALFLLAEPIGASLLAILLLQEMISLHEIIGGLFILSGIYLSVRQSSSKM